MYAWALVTLCLVLGCSASKPGCCMPNKFEAVEFMQIATESHHRDDSELVQSDADKGHGKHSSLTEIMLHVSIDGTRKMTSSNGTSYTHGKATNWKVIQDFGKMKEYLLLDGGAKCKVGPLRRNWTAPCIPQNSQKLMSRYIGSPSRNYPVDTYSIPTPVEMEETHGKVEIFLQASSDGCWMVSESLQGRHRDVGFLVNIGIYNTTVGIKDPNVFKIPAACNKPQNEMEDPTFRFKPAVLP